MFATKPKEEKLTSDSVRIRIKRLMANKVPVTIATFIAEQKKDENFNVILEGDDGRFKQELSIMKERVIDILKSKLELRGYSQEKKLQIINQKIREQEDRIKKIEKGEIIYREGISEKDLEKLKKDNPDAVKVNIINERNKLKHYKVLKYIVENEGDGSYEEIDVDGMRCMSFLSKDGDLIPIFHNASKVSMYEDIASKKKFYKQEQDKIELEFLRENKSIFGGYFDNFLKVVFIILFIANVIWAGYNASVAKKYAELYSSSSLAKITETNAKVIGKVGDLFEQCIDPNSTLKKEVSEKDNIFKKVNKAVGLG